MGSDWTNFWRQISENVTTVSPKKSFCIQYPCSRHASKMFLGIQKRKNRRHHMFLKGSFVLENDLTQESELHSEKETPKHDEDTG